METRNNASTKGNFSFNAGAQYKAGGQYASGASAKLALARPLDVGVSMTSQFIARVPDIFSGYTLPNITNNRIVDLWNSTGRDMTHYPREPHSALFCGMTGSGKSEYALDLLEGPYRGYFDYIVILCPSIRHNKAYQRRSWIRADRRVFVINPGDHLLEWLRIFFRIHAGRKTLYIIDDCGGSKALSKRASTLTQMAMSGRRAQQTLWVMCQQYTSVAKGFREQTLWIALFYIKDRKSFEKCFAENDIVEEPEEIATLKKTTENNKTQQSHAILWAATTL